MVNKAQIKHGMDLSNQCWLEARNGEFGAVNGDASTGDIYGSRQAQLLHRPIRIEKFPAVMDNKKEKMKHK